MLKQDYKEVLQQYYDIKKMFQLPLKVKLYFSTLENIIQNTSNLDPYKQQVVDHSLIQSFMKQDNFQKSSYLLQMIKGIQNYYQTNDGTKQKEQASTLSTINTIQTSCHIQTFSLKISHWSACKFKYDKLKRNINIVNKKKNLNLNLQNYLIRKSYKKDLTIVFQTIKKQTSQQYKKISLNFKLQLFTVVYKQIFDCICDILRENIIQMIKTCLQENQNDKQTRQDSYNNQQPLSLAQNPFSFLTSQQITNYLGYKKKIVNRLSIGGFQFKNLMTKQINGEIVKIERSSKIDKIFKLQWIVKKSKTQLKNQFLQAINSKYKYKIKQAVLQQFAKKYKAVHEKYLINNKIYEQINIKEETNSEQQEIYFSKGIDNFMTSNYLQFMIVKVKNTQKEGLNKLIVVASLILGKQITLPVAIMFLEQFKNMMDRQQNQCFQDQLQDDADQFFSIGEENFQNKFQDFQQQPPMTAKNQIQVEQVLKEQAKSKNTNYLSHKFILAPLHLSSQQLVSQLVKIHFFTGTWSRGKHGGIIIISQQINNQLKKVVFKVVKHFGLNFRKILNSGSFINAALPICVFQKKSHLQVIGYNFSYAPLLFDRFYKQDKIDPIQRLKYVHLFNLSASNLGIGYASPLNPVIGQTWQGWIGGCPLYMEQISHHPPISYFNLYGRGYNIYGCIQAKVSVGFNNIACYSQKLCVIEFQDKTKIYFLFARMYTTGFLFGERQFHYVDKTFAYDVNNHIFATLYFGPNKNKKGVPIDYVHGSFLKVFPTYKQKFFEKVPIVFPDKAYIEKQLGSFEGIWNEKVMFEGKQYIDFTKELPYTMNQEQFALPSHSNCRKDLMFLRENNEDKAAQCKNIIQNIQRKDRKLRQKYRDGKKQTK